jgi:hypothetical protein
VQAEALELVAFAAVALMFAVVMTRGAAARRSVVMTGAAGLAGTAAIALVPSFDLAVLVVLAVGVVHASAGGTAAFPMRLRVIGLAVGLLSLGALLVRVQGPDVLPRFGAVGLVAGACAVVGLLPYIRPLDPTGVADPPYAPVAWLGFVGPAAAVVLVGRSAGLLTVDAGQAFAAMLIGLGVLNMAWGSAGAWLTADAVGAWRYSFIADWGLVLAGLGLFVVDAQRAALLGLFTIVLCRLPLYLVSSQVEPSTPTTERPLNLAVAAALAGSAPFAGFAARVLLLRAATQLYWPLALVLALAMLAWLPGSLRLGRSLGLVRGRQAVAVALTLALNVAAGLYPLPLLAAARL